MDRLDGPMVDPWDWSTDALKEKILEDNDDFWGTFLEDEDVLELDIERKNKFSDLDSMYYHFQLMVFIKLYKVFKWSNIFGVH